MDVVLWKPASSLRSIVPVAATDSGQCQTSEGSEAQIRSSMQVSLIRSFGTKFRSCLPASSSHSSVDCPNTSIGHSVTPVPFPPPRSFIPSPLKFLWFNKKNQQTSEEISDLDLSLGITDRGLSEGKDYHSASTADPQSVTSPSGDYQISETVNEHVGTDSTDLVADPETCGDLQTTVESSIPIVSEGRGGQDFKQKNETENVGRNWVSRFFFLKSFGQDSKKYCSEASANTILIEDGEQVNTEAKIDGASLERDFVTGCKNCTRCSQYKLDNLQGCCQLEIPHVTVPHNTDSFSKFLQNVSLFDTKMISQMSLLCNLAYRIPDIKPGELFKYHRLRFVTSSLEKKSEAASKLGNINATADMSAASSKSNPSGREDNDSSSSGDEVRHSISVISTADSKLEAGAESSGQPPSHPKDELVDSGRKLCKAIEYTIAPAELISDADLEPPEPLLDGRSKSLTELYVQSSKEQDSSDVSSLIAAAPVTAVAGAEETKQPVSMETRSLHSCPCEWFVCDDQSSHTRIFVIQGSGSLASWQANLLFEPTKFEGLGVLVHRGIYEAAKGLYEKVLPDVLAHLKLHGKFTQIRFTGHSLGGSLATVIALMLIYRGVVPQSALLPVITFGSPCIMCGGNLLLEKLGLPQSLIQSVIMHRDIVPRVFSCDYPDHVAKVLKRLNGAFRDHPCLNNQRLLYAPMGHILILQPDEKQSPPHPFLSDGSGLYLVRNLHNGQDIDSVTQLRAAQMAFLNMPHPLEILSDPGAYGFDGTISRDHDPRGYLEAIKAVLRQQLKRRRRLQREQRKQLWWPLVTAESSVLVQKGLKSDLNSEGTRSGGVLGPALTKTSVGFRQFVKYATGMHFEVSQDSFVSRPHKRNLSRYARLIASQHIQIGAVFFLSVRMLIVDGLSVFYEWI
eukprot:c20242_g1_i1 orf=207-2927(-)